MNLTDEQATIVAADVPPGTLLKTVAYAGTGKTSTLIELSGKYGSEDVLYLAFNRSVADEAAMKFPCNTTSKTAHGLAYSHVARRYGSISNISNWQLSKAYRVPLYEAALLRASLEAFLCSADPEPAACHIEPDHLNKFNPITYVDGMVQKVDTLWNDMVESRNGIPMSHSGYLKIFQLRSPVLGFPVVLLDEAQDTNPVVLKLVLDQAQRGSRVYLVGDPYQQIYSWRGALDAMGKVEAPLLRLSQSFRFGPPIADFASTVLSRCFNESVPLRGLSSITSSIGGVVRPYTVITRTNAGLVDEAYSLACSDARIHVVGETAFAETLAFIDQIYLIYANKPGVTDSRLRMHKTYRDLTIFAEESLDAELKSKIAVIETHKGNWPSVRAMIQKQLTTSREADVLLTTTHKAKGLEWDNVRIAGDFQPLHYPVEVYDPETKSTHTEFRLKTITRDREDDRETSIHAEEVNLLYVATTRAKRRLQLTNDLTRLRANV